MSAAWPGIPAVVLYLAGALLVARHLRARNWMVGKTTRIIAGVAALLHAASAWLAIATPDGVDFSLFVVGSLVAVVLVAALLLVSLAQPLHNLYLLMLPLAALAIVGSLLLGGTTGRRAQVDIGLVAHAVVAVAAYSVLALAAFQSLLYLVLDRRLRHHEAIGAATGLPPLQTMESMLFVLLWTGLALLTGAIVTALAFLDDVLAPHLVQHTTLATASWFLYVVLLGGHFLFGWRGRTTTLLALVAFAVLALAYFGGKFVVEFLTP